MIKAPILILLFNRPKFTLDLINKIKRFKPKKLYIHCDGPRKNIKSDKKKISKIKKIIKREINWKCKLITKYQKRNIGLREAIINGIDFFFRKESSGIILEDSILPQDEFFLFCDQLLDKYKHNKKISVISGWNPIQNLEIKESYMFSELPKIWGWATWKRSWVKFDKNMNAWPNKKKNEWMKVDLKKDFFFRYFWEKVFNDSYLKNNKTWDYNLVYSNWCNKTLTIVPKYNLVQNQDKFQKEKTTHKNNFKIDILKKKLKFPLIHPVNINVNSLYDKLFYEKFYNFKIFYLNLTLIKFLKKFLRNI